MEIPVRIREKLELLPDRTGVYLMKDGDGDVIYVGKAASLRKRVRSYFQDAKKESPKERILVSRTADLDYMVTDNEVEALILECNLIKRYRPRYNVRLKDDKSYPYLKVTTDERFPRLFITRTFKNDGARYFGPYTDVKAVRRTLRLIRRIFPLRTCKQEPQKRKGRPCLNYHIDKCLGPCTGNLAPEEYANTVQEVILFLEGKKEELAREIAERMEEAAGDRDFERAARLRDALSAVKKVTSSQKISETGNRMERDVVAVARGENAAAVQIFRIRRGKMIGRQEFELEGVGESSLGEVLAAFLEQYYINSPDVPAQILVSHDLEEVDLIASWLAERRGGRVQLHYPQRGKNRRLVEMALENARLALDKMEIERRREKEERSAALEELEDILGLKDRPRRIEGIDISNLQGHQPVGSLVVFFEGAPAKEGYRRFQIKTEGPDDTAMIAEVVGRRFRHIQKENLTPPDLLLVDGGRGQVNAACRVLEELDQKQPVVGLAKEEEEIFLPGGAPSLNLPDDSAGLKLLMRVRDEAHRFAVNYHRQLRSRRLTHSVLDDIPGVGKKRRKALLNHFGSMDRIRRADRDDFTEVEGISTKMANVIYEYLQERITPF